MKTEKNQSKIKGGSVGTVVTAFVTGAAAGLTVGVLLSSNKGGKLKDKLTGLISQFSGSSGNNTVNERDTEPRPVGYTPDTDEKPDPDDKREYYDT